VKRDERPEKLRKSETMRAIAMILRLAPISRVTVGAAPAFLAMRLMTKLRISSATNIPTPMTAIAATMRMSINGFVMSSTQSPRGRNKRDFSPWPVAQVGGF